MQHQVLGSDQWTALATGLQEPGWAAVGLRKGLQHVFRVLSTSGKSSSKPSPPSEPVKLLERGEWGVLMGSRTVRREMGWEGSLWWRLKGWSGLDNCGGRNSVSGPGPRPPVAAGFGTKLMLWGQTSWSPAFSGRVLWTKG